MAAKTGGLLLLSLITGITLSACSGSSEATKSYDSVGALAKALGCSGVAPDKRIAGVKDQGHCRLDGERMTIYIWPKVGSKEPGGASPFGGGWVVLGKNWTVTALTADGVKKIQDKLGGQVK
jgi:hypothetical protein